MKKLFWITCFFLLTSYLSHAQEVVKLFQPSTYAYFYAGQQLTDSTSRYFVSPRSSAYLSNGIIQLADFNGSSRMVTLKPALKIDSINGYWNAIVGSYDLFHVPLSNGDAVIGNNGFECDIAFSSLTYVTREGELLWHLDYNTEFPVNVIDSIGFVDSDVIAIIEENGLVYYFDLEGKELFYEQPPLIYYKVIEHDGFYYGTRQSGVYKLTHLFEVVDFYPLFEPLYLQYVGNGEFIVSTQHLTFLLNAQLNELNVNFQIDSTLSVTTTSNYFWIVTPDGLFQTTKSLVVQKHYHAEPFEKMIHAMAYDDTVYVGSEYDGIYHQDIVIRKYGPEVLEADMHDISISSIYIDTVIREIEGSRYTLRFDSIIIEVHNDGPDTIHSLVVNWDWQLYFSFCSSLFGQIALNSLAIPPGESQTLQIGLMVTDPVYFSHIDPNFCFWVDSANGQPDIWPEDNLLCYEAEIINNTSELQTNGSLSITPNPASVEVLIENKTEQSFDHLYFYTSHGTLKHDAAFSDKYLRINIQDWSAGIYFIRGTNGDQYTWFKFVKQ